MAEPQKFLIEITRVEEPISENEVLMALRRMNPRAWVKVTRQK